MTTPDQPDRVEHRLERTYEVTATPEQVWDVIANCPGDLGVDGADPTGPPDRWRRVVRRRLLVARDRHRLHTADASSPTQNRGRSLTTCRPPAT